MVWAQAPRRGAAVGDAIAWRGACTSVSVSPSAPFCCASSCRCRRRVVPSPSAGDEPTANRRADQADEQRHPVPEQAHTDRLAGGDTQRMEQQTRGLPDPEAPSEIGRTCAMRRGDEREDRAVGDRHASVDRAPDRCHHGGLVRDGSGHAHRPAGLPPGGRPACTAPTKRIQFWCFSKRPARSGCPATNSTTIRRDDRSPAMAIEIQHGEVRAARLDDHADRVSSGNATSR